MIGLNVTIDLQWIKARQDSRKPGDTAQQVELNNGRELTNVLQDAVRFVESLNGSVYLQSEIQLPVACQLPLRPVVQWFGDCIRLTMAKPYHVEVYRSRAWIKLDGYNCAVFNPTTSRWKCVTRTAEFRRVSKPAMWPVS